MEKKMTMRDFLRKVSETTADAEVKAYALEQIDKLDERNKAHSSKETPQQKENAKLLPIIVSIMQGDSIAKNEEGYVVASALAEIVTGATGLEVSTNRVSALLHKLVESGDVIVKDKVKSAKGKGTVKGYKLAEFSTCDAEEVTD